MPTHKWVPSRLGHGEQMCANCFVTNREAAVLGELNACPNPDSEQAGSSEGLPEARSAEHSPFDSTPAGKALRWYRSVVKVAAMSDIYRWSSVQEAERALINEIERLQRGLDVWRDLAERADNLALSVFRGETKADHDRARHNAAVLTNDISRARQNEHLEYARNVSRPSPHPEA